MKPTMRHSIPVIVGSLALGLAAGATGTPGGADLFVAGTLGEVYLADPDIGDFELFGGSASRRFNHWPSMMPTSSPAISTAASCVWIS